MLISFSRTSPQTLSTAFAFNLLSSSLSYHNIHGGPSWIFGTIWELLLKIIHPSKFKSSYLCRRSHQTLPGTDQESAKRSRELTSTIGAAKFFDIVSSAAKRSKELAADASINFNNGDYLS